MNKQLKLDLMLIGMLCLLMVSCGSVASSVSIPTTQSIDVEFGRAPEPNVLHINCIDNTCKVCYNTGCVEEVRP